MTAATQPQDRHSASEAPGAPHVTRPALAAVPAQKDVNRPFRTPGHRPSKHDVDDWKYAQMVERHIRVLADRAAVSDASVWADLVNLKAVIDEVAADAAAKLHAGNPGLGLEPLPYSAFADELHTTPQNIYQRWFKRPGRSS